MFSHSQRPRAALRMMRRVLASVLALELFMAPVQGDPHRVHECQQVISIHDVGKTLSEVTGGGDGCGQEGNDQSGPNRPDEPDARFAIFPDVADGRDERSQAEHDDDDGPLR